MLDSGVFKLLKHVAQSVNRGLVAHCYTTSPIQQLFYIYRAEIQTKKITFYNTKCEKVA